MKKQPLQTMRKTYTISDRATKIYDLVVNVFDYNKSSDIVTPLEVVRKQVEQSISTKSNATYLVPGAGIGTYVSVLIAKGIEPSNIYAVEIDPAYHELGDGIFKRFGVNYIHADFLTWQPNMKFDVIVGNPPYNNAGKVKGQRSTSGTSMWIQFLSQTVRSLKPGGFCSLLVPSAVGNTNSVGWRALKDVRVVKITTGMEKYFNVSTAISMISFVNDSPSDYLDVNGVAIKRTKVNILPIHSNPLAISIMDKLQNAGPRMSWFRSNFPKFVEAATGNSNILGMPALDRGLFMRPRTLQELTSSGKLTKCEILRVEVEDPVKFMEFVKNPLFRFFHSQTGATGNQTLGILRFLTLPINWQLLETDEDIYHAYGLTEGEIEFVVTLST